MDSPVDLGTPDPEPEFGFDGVTHRWRGQLTDAEMVGLVRAHGGRGLSKVAESDTGPQSRLGHCAGKRWWSDRFRECRVDGRDHAFLLDTKTHSLFQRKGIGRSLVELAAKHAKAAGCEWLHVDFAEWNWSPSTLTRAGSANARRAHPFAFT